METIIQYPVPEKWVILVAVLIFGFSALGGLSLLLMIMLDWVPLLYVAFWCFIFTGLSILALFAIMLANTIGSTEIVVSKPELMKGIVYV